MKTENLLKKSKLPSLKIRRLRTIAVETFKIIHRQSPSYLHDLISIKDQKYNFRHQDKAVLPRVRTTRYGLNSFRYNAAQIWNELPNLFRQETSLEHFKNIIHTWNGSSCQCMQMTFKFLFLNFNAFKYFLLFYYFLLLLKCMSLLFLACFCSVDICFCNLCLY